MKKLYYSTQLRKDFKKYRNQPEKLKSHKLTGQYKGCLKCHIEGDFLLIWIDEGGDFIEIIRIGSHSELFKK